MSTRKQSFFFGISVVVAWSICKGALGLTSAGFNGRRNLRLFGASKRWASSEDAESSGMQYAPLKEEDIRKRLDTISVYAVVENSKDGLVLLKENGNPNLLAYLFFSAEEANCFYSPLRLRGNRIGEADWDIKAFPLGLVYYSLLKNPTCRGNDDLVIDGIEYRMIPSKSAINKARELTSFFQKDYNQIPLFIDRRIRFQDSSVPLFFNYEDAVETTRRATASVGGDERDREINVSELFALVDQMQQISSTNFQQAIFIPAQDVALFSNESPKTLRISDDAKDSHEVALPEIQALNQWDD